MIWMMPPKICWILQQKKKIFVFEGDMGAGKTYFYQISSQSP